MSLNAIILAAGEGTRMKSKTPKVLHKVVGKSMVEHVIDAADEVGCTRKIVVVGSGRENVEIYLSKLEVTFVHQAERLGSGHAVMVCDEEIHPDEDVLILCGDTPLIQGKTLQKLIDAHKKNNNACTVLTAELEEPFGYGRIVRDASGNVLKIVEEKDADTAVKQIKEINSGIYCFKGDLLKTYLKKIDNNNSQNEYYLTDMLELLNAAGFPVGTAVVDDFDDLRGVNSRLQLSESEAIFRKRINDYWMQEGVTFIDPSQTYIEKSVLIGRDTILYPGTHLSGKTIIGEDCEVGPNAHLDNVILGNVVSVKESTLADSSVDERTTVGPYAYVRPGCKIGTDVKIGDFVEIKNSSIGNDTKISHLTYVGDAEVGERVNLGCGVVFVNYDGKNKFKTVVEDDCFVGCNVNLVSPVTVEKGAYVAAGSTITKDVPAGALGVARQRQTNIDGWVERKGIKK
jgi:bifunctional UDP-N-acetylglucosamine pyrophosphorylase/glucosamine-1-phosphate N-acetyltransferase